MVSIRTFEKDDIDKTFDILKSYEEKIFDAEDLHIIHNHIQKFLQNEVLDGHKSHFAYIVTINSIMAGVILIAREPNSSHSFEIICLAIAKEYAHQHLGSFLLREAIEKVKHHGAHQIFLKTSDETYNMPAKKFYEKMGFKKVGILPDYWEVDPKSKKFEDCALFQKKL